MVRCVALLLVLGSTVILSYINYATNVTGQIKDGVPFRVICHLNTTIQPLFNMMVFGYSANKTLLIGARVSFIGVIYQMVIYTNIIKTNLHLYYNQTYTKDLSGTPAVPLVMGFGQKKFFATSYEHGLNASIASQAESLTRIEVAADGPNLVDCGTVECFHGN